MWGNGLPSGTRVVSQAFDSREDMDGQATVNRGQAIMNRGRQLSIRACTNLLFSVETVDS